MRTLEPSSSTNGYRHSEPVSLARVTRMERRFSELAESSEQRVNVLRDAISDFIAAELAPRDEAIARLKEQIANLKRQLQAKTEIDQQVAEVAMRLDARQVAREE